MNPLINNEKYFADFEQVCDLEFNLEILKQLKNDEFEKRNEVENFFCEFEIKSKVMMLISKLKEKYHLYHQAYDLDLIDNLNLRINDEKENDSEILIAKNNSNTTISCLDNGAVFSNFNFQVFSTKKKNKEIIQKTEQFQIRNKKQHFIVPSYFYNLEICGEIKIKPKNCIVKQHFFNIYSLNKSAIDINVTKENETFTQNKNQVVTNQSNNKNELNISNISEFGTMTDQNKQTFSLNYSKIMTHQETNKSLNDETISKIEIKKPNESNSPKFNSLNKTPDLIIKKGDKLTDSLKNLIEKEFEKYRRNEMNQDTLFEVIKTHLNPYRALFISSKSTKDKFFQETSKGSIFYNNLLNKVFRSLVEDSLKGLNQANKKSKNTSKSPFRPITEVKKAGADNPVFTKTNLTPERINLNDYKTVDDKRPNKIQFNQNISKIKLNLNNSKKEKNSSLPYIK